jgi:fumarate hydratase class II
MSEVYILILLQKRKKTTRRAQRAFKKRQNRRQQEMIQEMGGLRNACRQQDQELSRLQSLLLLTLSSMQNLNVSG